MAKWCSIALETSIIIGAWRLYAITWASADLLSIGPSGTKFSGIFNIDAKILIQEHAFKNAICVILTSLCSSGTLVFQDSYGDTALHDAIGKESREILEMLINHPSVDFSLKNKRGFNVLHHAALKGNEQWVGLTLSVL